MVKDGTVRRVGSTPPANNSIDRVIEKAPDLMDTIESLIKKRKSDVGE